MDYPDEYYENLDKIDELKAKLSRLDSDYQTLKYCIQLLAECSSRLDLVLTQCDEIAETFDRSSIEGRYDSCGITFPNKGIVFDSLTKIGTLTINFNESFEAKKNEIEKYARGLEEKCKDIADKAKTCAESIYRYKEINNCLSGKETRRV